MLCTAGLVAWDQSAPIRVTWWLRDAAGALVVTPEIVRWARSGWRDLREGAAGFGPAVTAGSNFPAFRSG
jgi:integral membrane sensor domain MASE1